MIWMDILLDSELSMKKPRQQLKVASLKPLLVSLAGDLVDVRTVYEETTSTIKGRESQTIAGVARWRPC